MVFVLEIQMQIQPVVVEKVSVFRNEMDLKYMQEQVYSVKGVWCETVPTLFVG